MTSHLPWYRRLSTQLLGLAAAMMLVAALAYGAFERGVQEVILAQASAGAALFGETIASATRRAMLEDHRNAAYGTMEAIGRQPGIDRVRMINRLGAVTFSTEPGEVGATFDRSSETCAACHAGSRPRTRLSLEERGRIVTHDAHRAVQLISPVYGDARCSTAGCHHHDRPDQVLGVIDVTVSLDDADQRIEAFRERGLAVTAVGMVGLGVLLTVFARRRVVRPVAALMEGTRRVARDELDLEIPALGGGELGLLADSFNDMTRALRRSEGDLRQLNQDLEAKVRERTAELERAHVALVQTEKLSSLGQLAASIAHEINNPLAGILTYAKLLQREAEEDVPDPLRRASVIKRLAMVQRESERCSAIVRNLLDFARERPLQLRDVDVNKVVRESLELIGHQLVLQGDQVETSLAELPPVHGDFGELRQAFVNLALNAMEAMGRGGRLGVETRAAAEGQAVEIAISDSGPGIPPEIRNKIFDPFFTTKEKGTGLGLSVVYGIVQRHGGTVTLVSEPGQGTCFTIRLPVSATRA